MRDRLLAVALLSLSAACGKMVPPGFDAGVKVDAGFDAGEPKICLADRVDAGATEWDGGYDFSCRGQARTGGQDVLLVAGETTRAGFSRSVMQGVKLELLSRDGTVLATTVSAGDGGTYELAFDAGCEPIDGEVRATVVNDPTDAGFFPSYAVPAAPWRHDREGLELVLFDASTRGLLGAVASVTLQPQTASIALSIEDCAGHEVQGALLSAGDAGVVRYVGASGLPTMQQTSTNAKGEVVVFNLVGSSVELTATLDGQVIVQRVVPIHADAVTGLTLAP